MNNSQIVQTVLSQCNTNNANLSIQEIQKLREVARKRFKSKGTTIINYNHQQGLHYIMTILTLSRLYWPGYDVPKQHMKSIECGNLRTLVFILSFSIPLSS